MMINVTDAVGARFLDDSGHGNTTPWLSADNLGLLNMTVNLSSHSNISHHDSSSSTDTLELVTTPAVYDRHVPNYPQAVLITLCILLGCMIVATVLGNVFVITAILIERSLQGVSNYLVLSLAVTDLLVAVLVMPLSLLNEVSVFWYLGRALCDMWVSVDVLCCTASILHLVAIAMDRFWAVSKIDYVRRRCARQILLMIAVVWLVSVAISIPPLFGWRHETDNPELSGVCMISQDHGYTIFSTVGAFYCPLVLMLVLNYKIYRAARYRIRRKGFAQAARKSRRGGHGKAVPVVHVEQDTAARDHTRNSSGSDVSQDGISMFNPSCLANNEISRADTGMDSNTVDYDPPYSYYAGDSTTDSNQNESYYPVATEDPDLPASTPCFMMGPMSPAAETETDKLCVETIGPVCGHHQLDSNCRSLSSNHLIVSDPCQRLESRYHHHSASDVSRCVSCDIDPLSFQASKHLAMPESNSIDGSPPVQITVLDCDPSVTECKLVQFDSTIRIEGDIELEETAKILMLEEEEALTGDRVDCIQDSKDTKVNDTNDTATGCCPNNLLNVELNCVSSNHLPYHQLQENHVEVDSAAGDVQKHNCNQLHPDTNCLHVPNSRNSSSPSTTVTITTTSVSGGFGNQLRVPRAGMGHTRQPSKSRANNNTKRARNREKEKQRREKLEMRRERKAARVLGIITGAFVLCWLPFFILALLVPFLPSHCYVPPVLISLFVWLGYFNSLLNPIIYTVFNPSFRKAFRKIFFKRLSSLTRS